MSRLSTPFVILGVLIYRFGPPDSRPTGGILAAIGIALIGISLTRLVWHEIQSGVAGVLMKRYVRVETPWAFGLVVFVHVAFAALAWVCIAKVIEFTHSG